jgi:BirA family biotin operon repressor/biotin-[acetyl-CoA-carboxylase] ligase
VILAPGGPVLPAYFVFIASLAVADALKDSTELQPKIKWPNDVYVNGRKLAGILVENHSTLDHRIVVGMGINANIPVRALADFNPHATSVFVETGRLVSRETLAANLLRSLEVWYRCLTRDPYDVFSAWKGRLDTLGSLLQVHDSQGTWSGVGMDVQEDGGLIVERADGKRQVVYAADVSVRPRSGLQVP